MMSWMLLQVADALAKRRDIVPTVRHGLKGAEVVTVSIYSTNAITADTKSPMNNRKTKAVERR